MDVHQETIAVADVAQDPDAEVVSRGPIGTRQADIDPRMRKMPSKAQHLVFVDEAGPCGSWLSRDLTTRGHVCWVVAPSLIPQKAGDRVKTDRRDAVLLARLRRSGDRTPVDVPTVEDAASRDLRRAREEALGDLQTATFRRKALLRRHDLHSTGRATWGPAPRRWLSDVLRATPAQRIVCQAYVRAVTKHTARLQRRDQALPEQVQSWRLQPVVEALEGLRGVPCIVAVTMVAALGDLTRVEKPRHVMN
jgi:transposase